MKHACFCQMLHVSGSPDFIPEATVPYDKCVEAVMQIMFEQDLKPMDEMFGAGALKKITEKRQKARNIVV